MCGRFALTTPPEALASLVGFSAPVNYPPRYNIAPSQPVTIIRATPQAEMATTAWGLVPPWRKPEQVADKSARPQINARAETVAEKLSFKNAFKRRRCLIPADGFYEWDRKTGQPYLVRRVDGAPFFMAGLWEIWADANGSEIESCAIITVTANNALCAIHHRMPAMLKSDQAGLWLNGWLNGHKQADQLLTLLRPAPEADFEAAPISKRVNMVSADDADLWRPEQIEKIEQPPEQLALL